MLAVRPGNEPLVPARSRLVDVTPWRAAGVPMHSRRPAASLNLLLQV